MVCGMWFKASLWHLVPLPGGGERALVSLWRKGGERRRVLPPGCVNIWRCSQPITYEGWEELVFPAAIIDWLITFGLQKAPINSSQADFFMVLGSVFFFLPSWFYRHLSLPFESSMALPTWFLLQSCWVAALLRVAWPRCHWDTRGGAKIAPVPSEMLPWCRVMAGPGHAA